MKYEYDEVDECFKRVDNRGRHLKINIVEARDIDNLLNLGYSVSQVYQKLNLDVTVYTLRTFVNNLREGNINLDEDYELPIRSTPRSKYEEWDDRISRLEDDLATFEKVYLNKSCECEKQPVNFWDKIRSKLRI